MGEDGRYEYADGVADTHFFVVPDGEEHKVSALIVAVSQDFIKKGNESSCGRQKKQQPWMLYAQTLRAVRAEVEKCAGKSDDAAGQYADNAPFQEAFCLLEQVAAGDSFPDSHISSV